MIHQPNWITPPGNLGIIPENNFYQYLLEATDSEGTLPVSYMLIAGSLPVGVTIQADYLKGVPHEVDEDVVYTFAIRAMTVDNGVVIGYKDQTFSITVTGQDIPEWVTPIGEISEVYDNGFFEFQFQYTDTDINDIITVSLSHGDLPPGLTLTSLGSLSGNPEPVYSIDPLHSDDTVYQFTLKITDGKNSAVRDFSISIISYDDTGLLRNPYLINHTLEPDDINHDNFYALQLTGVQPNDYDIRFEIVAGSLPVTLTLNPESGWLYGYLDPIVYSELTYNFTIELYLAVDPLIRSIPYEFTYNIINDSGYRTVWLTDSILGTIENGAYSTFYIEAESPIFDFRYRLKSGAHNKLPPGLTLTSTGEIVGQVDFNTFMLDGGTTTFDQTHLPWEEPNPTTIDLEFHFTAEAYSDQNISLSKTEKEFTIIVDPVHSSPYDVLYAQAFPGREDRALLNELLFDSEIMNSIVLYRPNDSHFGKAKHVTYVHAMGLTPSTVPEYFETFEKNHYHKKVVLGKINTAQATDNYGNVLYEVVYSEIIDTLVNPKGESVSPVIDLNSLANKAINTGIGGQFNEPANEVYPNSFINMRNQTLEQISAVSETLPRWMISRQQDGSIIGFIPAWVIAYTKPGHSEQMKYNIATRFGDQLNKINFTIDRFILNSQVKNIWDTDTDSWHGSVVTTFDSYNTVVDGGSCKFVSHYDIVTFDNDTTTFDADTMHFTNIVSDTHVRGIDSTKKYIIFPQVKIIDNDPVV